MSLEYIQDHWLPLADSVIVLTVCSLYCVISFCKTKVLWPDSFLSSGDTQHHFINVICLYSTLFMGCLCSNGAICVVVSSLLVWWTSLYAALPDRCFWECHNIPCNSNCSHTHWSTGHIRIVAMASISCSKPWRSIHKYTQVQSTVRIHHTIFLNQLQCWGLHLLWSLQRSRIRFITTYTLCIHGQIATLCIHWQTSIFIVDCWW